MRMLSLLFVCIVTSCKPNEVARSGSPFRAGMPISGHELDSTTWAVPGHADWVLKAYAKWKPLSPLVEAMRRRDYDDVAGEARRTLPAFETAFTNPEFSDASFAVKMEWKTNSTPEPSRIWFGVREYGSGSFATCPLELPDGSRELVIGHEVTVDKMGVEDWIIYRGGTVYGGYSLRRYRSTLPGDSQVALDKRLKITHYADSIP